MDFNTIFEKFCEKNILIIGDSMIDTYMWGVVNRVSPEAPVPVVEIKKHENRLGGAANVALNLSALGAKPILCSVIGDDAKGDLFLKLMNQSKLPTSGIIRNKERKTTVKTRVIADNKHQLRIDEEETNPISNSTDFLNLAINLMTNIDAIIMQDYNKGVLTPLIIKEIIKKANYKNIPIIVDPKINNFNCYKNCTIFKPNLSEIKAGINVDFNANNKDQIKDATTKLRNILNAKSVLLTLSEKGICTNSTEGFILTPAYKRNIIDVSGAGDTVIAVASLCLASQINYEYLSKLSSLAGGIVCEDVGVVSVNKKKLLKEAIKLIKN